MKSLFSVLLFLFMSPAFAVTWSYQVNINNKSGQAKSLDATRNTFEAGDYFCEVTPVVVNNNTEFRSLNCGVGTATVGTGGLCTRRASKNASVQYAILNINGPKSSVNVVVACKFE